MPIRTCTFDRLLADRYLDLCRELYRGDANWIPPAGKQLREQFDLGFGFHREAGNAHLHFLASAGGALVGHASAMVNSRLKDRDGTPVGTIGFYECIDDTAVAAELLDGARGWLRKEHGLRRIWGPMQFDVWHGYRLMTRGFDTVTFLGEPYNKPYYPAQFAASGFHVRKRWFSVEIEGAATLRKLMDPLQADHAQALVDGYRIEPMDIRDPAVVRLLHAAVEDSYRRFLGITRIDLAEFREIFAGYARGLDSRFALAAWSPAGTLGGFILGYPDYGRALQALRSRRSPAGLLRFWLRARAVQRVVGFMIGITPHEALRGHRLGRALAFRCLRSVIDAGFDSIVLALLAEDSPAWMFLAGGRFEPRKEYALYESNVD